MATAFNDWDSYFWEPGGHVLKNLYGLRHNADLGLKEYAETNAQEFLIRAGQINVPRTYDAEHLKTLHRELFGNVYEWAGEYRSVGIMKPHPAFKEQGVFANPGDIEPYLKIATQRISDTDWASLNKEQFAHSAADLYSIVNVAHPFREGNGRAAKLFMDHVSEQSKFSLDLSKVSPELWNSASRASMPAVDEIWPHPEHLEPAFLLATTERSDASPGQSEIDKVMARVRSSYPQIAPGAARHAAGMEAGATSYTPPVPGRDTPGMGR